MSGLLEKDFRILLSRKKNLFLFLFIAVFIGYVSEGIFIVGYLPFLMSILTISTLSYDEMNNGYKYMMTLPIDTKSYVIEKFVFCICGGLLSWAAAVVIMFGVYMIKGVNYIFIISLAESFCVLPVIMIIEALMITAQLKYGMEKSRVILATIGGFIVLVAFIAKTVLSGLGGTALVIATAIDSLPLAVFLIVFYALAVIVFAVCMRLSMKIMENKEY